MERLGHYRIEAKLGAGGMGVVYRARDTRLERTVALKVVGEGQAANPDARTRLLNEARAASALNHPNICTIYEVSEAEGQAFIAMEYVEGRPLSTLIPADGLAAEGVLRYGQQIADALAHAHERGIVHGDLKCANVVITPEGRAKVLDFGLAEHFGAPELSEATRSEALLNSKIAGTLPYMAPELLRGDPAHVCTDLWALGVVLYEMAAGGLPFSGKTGFELSSAILREAPVMPLRLPTGLRAIIQRCLAKEPGRRYQRASEVRTALEILFLSSETSAEREEPTPAPERPRLSTGGRASPIPEANEYFEKAMLGARHLSFQWTRQMLERALELDPDFGEARALYGYTHILMIELGYSNDAGWLYKAEEEIRRVLPDDPDSVWAHTTLASLLFYQGHKELVPGEVQKALKSNPNSVPGRLRLVRYHMLDGDFAEAHSLAEQLVESDPVYVPARRALAHLLEQQGDTKGAIRQQEKVLEQDPQHTYALCLLARCYMDLGDFFLARQTLERARPEDRSLYLVRLAWALLFALEEKREQALKEMDQEVLEYAEVAVFWTSTVAAFYSVLGEPAKALTWLERAVRVGDERDEWFRRDPLLANLRDHPRFQQILESIAFRRQQRAGGRAHTA